MELEEAIFTLVKKCSTDLPPDVEDALRKAVDSEETGSPAESALKTILENVELARRKGLPICQDTGTPVFYVHYPTGMSTLPIVEAIVEESHKHNKPVFVHCYELEETVKPALRAGADVLVHSVRYEEVDDEFIKLCKKSDVKYIPTLCVFNSYESQLSTN